MKKGLFVALTLAAVLGGAWWLQRDPVAPVEAVAPGAAASDVPAPVDSGVAQPERAPVPAAGLTDGAVVVRGVVVDLGPDGQVAASGPAAEVEVTAQWFLSGMGGEPEPSTRTGADGRFQLDVPLEGRAERQVTIRARGDTAFRDGRTEVTLRAGATAPAEIVVERHPHGALVGVVVDRHGAPIPEVRIAHAEDLARSLSVLTDTEGRFRFAEWTARGQLDASLDGWRMVAPCPLRPTEAGGWEDVRIVLVRAGALVVRVVDAEDRPLPGVLVSLRPTTGEPFSAGLSSFNRFNGDRGRTDDRGTVRFDSVWADAALEVTLGLGAHVLRLERECDGIALPGDQAGTRAIAVPPGETRTLTVRIGHRASVRGIVLDADETPHAGAHVRVTALDAGPDEARFDALVQTGADGRFEIEARTLAPLGRARVVASSSEGSFFRWRDDDEPEAASADVDLADPPADLRLVLAPTEELTGRVVDAEGVGLAAELRLFPLDTGFLDGRLATGFHAIVHAKSDGSFRFAGLPRGRFDVLATAEDHAEVRVKDVPAGTQGLTVEMGGPRAAVLHLEVESPGVELAQVIVLHGRLDLDPGRSVDAPILPRSGTWAEPSGWPEYQVQLWIGAQGDRTEEGALALSLTPIDGSRTTLAVDPGLRWIGVKGRTADGRVLAPVGTGLVRVEPGEHHLVFRVRPTAAVRGIVRGVTPDHRLHAALAGDRGELLHLGVRRAALAPTSPIGLEGEFLLNQVPDGRWEVRVGTRDELMTGRARARRTIEVGGAAEVAVELQL